MNWPVCRGSERPTRITSFENLEETDKEPEHANKQVKSEEEINSLPFVWVRGRIVSNKIPEIFSVSTYHIGGMIEGEEWNDSESMQYEHSDVRRRCMQTYTIAVTSRGLQGSKYMDIKLKSPLCVWSTKSYLLSNFLER